MNLGYCEQSLWLYQNINSDITLKKTRHRKSRVQLLLFSLRS